MGDRALLPIIFRKDDPTSTGVHVDAVMGSGRRRGKRQKLVTPVMFPVGQGNGQGQGSPEDGGTRRRSSGVGPIPIGSTTLNKGLQHIGMWTKPPKGHRRDSHGNKILALNPAMKVKSVLPYWGDEYPESPKGLPVNDKVTDDVQHDRKNHPVTLAYSKKHDRCVIVNGHHHLAAAMRQGISHMPVVVIQAKGLKVGKSPKKEDVPVGKTLIPLLKFNPNHDDQGRFSSGGGGGSGGSGGSGSSHPVTPITAAEARGNSRPVTSTQFSQLADQGRAQLADFERQSSPPTALDDNWDSLVTSAYHSVNESWGGVTIDAHTGKALPSDADLYALTVKDPGQSSVTIAENPTREQFAKAMKVARTRFDPQLSRSQHCLGVFHDDALHRIDIDPVLTVKTLGEVESIGAATHAIGGAYYFRDGNGYFPPHVVDSQPSATTPHLVSKAIGLVSLPRTHAQHLHDTRAEADPFTNLDDYDDDGKQLPHAMVRPSSPAESHFHQPLIPLAKFNPNHLGDGPGGGEFTSGPGGGGFHEPLIAPHYEHPEPTKSGRGGRSTNYGATTLAALPEAYRSSSLSRVKQFSPNGDLTPDQLDKNLEEVFQHAQSDPAAQNAIHWYDNAHARAQEVAAFAGNDIDKGVGIVAALSPQTDWDSNVAMAKYVGAKLAEDANAHLTAQQIVDAHTSSMKAKGAFHDITIPLDTPLSQMTTPQASWALMTMAKADDLKSDKDLTGGRGKAKAQLSMGSMNIGKAVDIYFGRATPDVALAGHKVRSFFNNIMDPQDRIGQHDVTVDTHAVSAASHARMAGKSQTLRLMFDRGSSTGANVHGTYAVFADAYRRLAARHNMTPNQAQAMVWTHWQTIPGEHKGYREAFPEVE